MYSLIGVGSFSSTNLLSSLKDTVLSDTIAKHTPCDEQLLGHVGCSPDSSIIDGTSEGLYALPSIMMGWITSPSSRRSDIFRPYAIDTKLQSLPVQPISHWHS
jgi:hypothetical protein